MKTLIAFIAGLIAIMLVGCGGTPKVGPAKTTLNQMKNVGHLTSVKRTTVVTSTGTNITMVETIESPESAQAKLRMKELEGQTQAAVAKAKQSVVVTTGYGGGYGGYGSGVYNTAPNESVYGSGVWGGSGRRW